MLDAGNNQTPCADDSHTGGRLRPGAVVVARIPEDNKAGRPVVVVRSNVLMGLPVVTVLPLTSDLDTYMPHWVRVEPTPENGLNMPSRIMTDWPQTIRVHRIAEAIGRVDRVTFATVNGLLTTLLGIGEFET